VILLNSNKLFSQCDLKAVSIRHTFGAMELILKNIEDYGKGGGCGRTLLK